jgi:enamidase
MNVKRILLRGAVGTVVVFLIAFVTLIVVYNLTLYRAESSPLSEIVIRGGTLFAATGTTPVPNRAIVLRDGRIACIGAACDTSAAAIEIDADGLAILPGLIDLHGHFLGRRDEVGVAEMVWDAVRMRPDYRRGLLEAGVTSYRDLGSPRDAIIEIRDALESGELEGPRLFIAGPIFTAPGGHPAYGGRDPNPGGIGGLMTFQSDDPEKVRAEILRLAARGVDGIKAVFHGNTAPSGEILLPTLSNETLRAIADEAKAHGLWVAVHVGPADESARAAAAGATTIEHGVRHGNPIDQTTLDVLRDSDIVYVPTLGREPEGDRNIPALVAAGITIGVGTDVEDYHGELGRLADAGMPAVEVLLAATRNGARALRLEDQLGALETGKLADVVLVAGEPWNDVRDLASIVAVIRGGRLVVDRRSAVDR